ncbi:hypothetical protein JCM11491_003050 [Sporobolomyces phaffii]
MSVRSLPTELLLEVFSFLAPPPFESFDVVTPQPYQDLLACALVHPDWRTPAQETLLHEIRATGIFDDKMAKIGVSLRRACLRSKPKRLLVDGDLGILLRETGDEVWSQTWYVRYTRNSNVSTDFRNFARFPGSCCSSFSHPRQKSDVVDSTALTTLHLEWTKINSSDDPVIFPNLRRLVLDNDLELLGQVTGYKRLFSPECMPMVSHLGLAAYADGLHLNDMFGSLLPQIDTLALSDHHSGLAFKSLHLGAAHLIKLKHLLINYRWRSNAREPLTAAVSRLALESLHFRFLTCRDLGARRGTLVEQMANIAMGAAGPVTSRRVVMYGSRAVYEAEFPDIDSSVFEWREGQDVPGLAEFDGQ